MTAAVPRKWCVSWCERSVAVSGGGCRSSSAWTPRFSRKRCSNGSHAWGAATPSRCRSGSGWGSRISWPRSSNGPASPRALRPSRPRSPFHSGLSRCAWWSIASACVIAHPRTSNSTSSAPTTGTSSTPPSPPTSSSNPRPCGSLPPAEGRTRR